MIREARPADEPALRRLQHELREYDPAFLSYAITGPPLVLVAGATRGYLVAVRSECEGVEEGSEHETVESRGRGPIYLAELVVDQASRRQGIASALLADLRERAAEEAFPAIELIVHPENEPARDLYRTHGYAPAERVPGFYADAGGVLMRRQV